MRICPKCGYHDQVCWRNNRWIMDVDYTRFEDFCAEYPGMADLHPGEERADNECFYRRGKKNPYFVYRWPKYLGPMYYTKSRHLFERHVPRAPPRRGQKQLGEMSENEATKNL